MSEDPCHFIGLTLVAWPQTHATSYRASGVWVLCSHKQNWYRWSNRWHDTSTTISTWLSINIAHQWMFNTQKPTHLISIFGFVDLMLSHFCWAEPRYRCEDEIIKTTSHLATWLSDVVFLNISSSEKWAIPAILHRLEPCCLMNLKIILM